MPPNIDLLIYLTNVYLIFIEKKKKNDGAKLFKKKQ